MISSALRNIVLISVSTFSLVACSNDLSRGEAEKILKSKLQGSAITCEASFLVGHSARSPFSGSMEPKLVEIGFLKTSLQEKVRDPTDTLAGEIAIYFSSIEEKYRSLLTITNTDKFGALTPIPSHSVERITGSLKLSELSSPQVESIRHIKDGGSGCDAMVSYTLHETPTVVGRAFEKGTYTGACSLREDRFSEKTLKAEACFQLHDDGWKLAKTMSETETEAQLNEMLKQMTP